MKRTFYMFDVITLFYILLRSWQNINALCTIVDCERFSVFGVER